jgi:hypothetical protein
MQDGSLENLPHSSRLLLQLAQIHLERLHIAVLHTESKDYFYNFGNFGTAKKSVSEY